jgi:hypothetical protein
MKNLGVITLGLLLAFALSYACWCIRENYKTGEWSEACGLIVTNPHYRECVERRTWIARDLHVVSSQPLPQSAGMAAKKPPFDPNKPYELIPDDAHHVVVLRGGDTIRFAGDDEPVKLPAGMKPDSWAPLIYMDGKKMSVTCGKFGDGVASKITLKTDSTIVGSVECETRRRP